ncbi:MAG: choice-of-anchor tandem repeat NxxGxxAF-containing protein, partial [Acidobacteriota bacterium]
GQKMFVRGGDGKWRLLLDQGEKSVDTSIVIDTFGLPHVNASGEVTFLANGPKVADNLPVTSDPNDPASFRPLVSNQVLYKKTKDGIRSIYRMGTEVPNMPSYITGISNVTSNNVGTTAFIGTYSEPDGRGLFFVADGKVSLIARSGQKIGKNETGTFSEHYYPSSINDRNEVAFLGRSGDKSGIFIGSPRGVEIIAFGGRPTPLKGANFLGFGNRTPAINNRGDILFVGFFDGPQAGRGLFLKPVDGPIRLIARSGDAITGTNWNLTDFSSISLSDNGDIAFSATYAGRSRGIFIKTAKGIEPVAILDQRIPGGDKDEVFNHFTQPDVNSRGEVVFYAQWRTPKTGVNIGVFWRDAQGVLRLLFKRGDMMPK